MVSQMAHQDQQPTRLQTLNKLASDIRKLNESLVWSEVGDGVTSDELLELNLAIDRIIDRIEMFRTNASVLRQVRFDRDYAPQSSKGKS